MKEQPETLRLADLLQDECGVDGYVHDEAAAELRRLAKAEAHRDALLEALKRLLAAYSVSHSPEHRQSCWDQARAAIKAVKEEA